MIFFLKRPVFAIIINCLFIALGLISFQTVEVREYPKITLPILSVHAFYPNASAELIESDVTRVLEDSLSEVPGLDAMTANIREGHSTITLYLKPGISIEKSMIYARDAIAKVRGSLPKKVKEPVIERNDQRPDGPGFMILSLRSKQYELPDLTHKANTTLKNSLRSINGISSVETMGPSYLMQITLNSKLMYRFGINVDDITLALKQNNVGLPAGKFQKEIPITFDLSMNQVADFEDLQIKGIPLKSMASVNRTIDERSGMVRINGHDGILLFLRTTSDANPLTVSNSVRQYLKTVKLSGDIDIKIESDQADFIRASLFNISSSVIEACILVPLLLFLFFGSWRAALIPMVTIPISLIGTIAALKLCGFSINVITLLAMILAIGLVVDDAIVVLENVDRHLKAGMRPFDAAKKSLSEISFSIVAMTLTLACVYMPIAFIHGVIGQIFVEFALALSIAVMISGVTALTLSPLMCAYFLRKEAVTAFFDPYMAQLSQTYKNKLTIQWDQTGLGFICSALIFAIGFLYINLPKSLTTPEDRGLIGAYIPNSTLAENLKNAEQVESMIGKVPEADSVILLSGTWGSNVIYNLKDWSKRWRSASQIADSLRQKTSDLPSTDVYVWNVESGLPGNYGGSGRSDVSFAVKTLGSYDTLFASLSALQQQLLKKFKAPFFNLQLDTPAFKIQLDRRKIVQTKVLPHQIAQTLQAYFGGLDLDGYVQDMIRYPLRIEGDHHPWALNDLYITTPDQIRMPLGNFAQLQSYALPRELQHLNQMRSSDMSVELKGSIPEAMKRVEQAIGKNLPSDVSFEWTGSAKAYLESSGTMLWMLLMALIFIYAVLAIQFESFIDPLIILFTVPLGVAGAFWGLYMMGCALNIYSYIGLITLIGLITKHGILIVEFTNQLLHDGVLLADAIRQACLLRLRPILMTSLTTVLGAIPLVLVTGAGFENRYVIGVTLIAGMTGGTLLTLIILPALLYSVKKNV